MAFTRSESSSPGCANITSMPMALGLQRESLTSASAMSWRFEFPMSTITILSSSCLTGRLSANWANISENLKSDCSGEEKNVEVVAEKGDTRNIDSNMAIHVMPRAFRHAGSHFCPWVCLLLLSGTIISDMSESFFMMFILYLPGRHWNTSVL